MKVFLALFLIFQTFIWQLQSSSNDIVLSPSGEYKTIADNIKESTELFSILIGLVDGNKAEAAFKVEKNLGSQIPPTILVLGNYYLTQGDFKKAALYHRLSMFRAIVDVRASNDMSLQDVIPILYGQTNEACGKLTPEQSDSYKKNIIDITKSIMAIDQQTPRNYDIRWASLHSIKAFTQAPLNYVDEKGLQNIIEQERKSYIETAKKDNVWQ